VLAVGSDELVLFLCVWCIYLILWNMVSTSVLWLSVTASPSHVIFSACDECCHVYCGFDGTLKVRLG